MLDLETLGKTSDAVILSIGAVPFDMDGNMGEPFEAFPTVEDQFKYRKIEWSTIQWWLEQEEGARKSIAEHGRSLSLSTYLSMFKEWCEENLDEKFRVWANGASFDTAMLNHAFDQCGLSTPWSYRNQMDCRTMVYMSKISTRRYDPVGIKHDAVTDCKWQITWTVDAYHILRGTMDNRVLTK